jgi:hypothetical protein
VYRTGDGQAQVGYSVARRLRGQVMLYMLCTVHKETRARVSWFCLKTKVNVLSVVWPQNHWDSFYQFGLKISGFMFPRLGLKISSNSLVI